SDKAGGIWAGTAGAGAAYIAPSGQITHYSTTSTPALKSDTVTAIAIDKTGVAWFSQGGSSADQSTHQGFACFENGVFTFINRDNSDLPNNRVNGLDVDNQGNVWLATTYNSGSAGTFLGGTAKYDSSADAWQSWTQADGLPTASTWSVKADNRGGAWVTTYRSGAYDDNPPDISYVYINPAGNVNAYDMPKETTTTHWSYSADIDSNGGVYIVRFSGTSDNVKGRLDYIAPGSGVVSKSYSATELLPAADLQDILDANAYGLVKVFVDAADNLWLSTDFSGVYRFTTANGLVDTASMVHYSSATGCWPAGPFDSVWSIHISPDGQAVFGSNGGVAWTIVELKPPDLDYVGDATPTTAQLTISGAVEKPGYFTLAGLQAYTELVQTKNYTWLNNAGNTGTTAATGIYLEDLLKNVMTLDPRTVSITLTASDNSVYTVQLNDQLLGASWLDGAGNKLMLAWLLDGNPPSRLPLQLMVGQTGPDHVNRALWLGGVIAITVNAGATQQETSVLDPPFTIKQGGKSDITWVIGGSGNSIKNLPNNAGKEEKMYKVNGQNINVRGAALSSILTASGIDGDNVLLTISTTDNSFKQQDIKLADISANEYFLAYDIFNAVNGEWDKIADVDKANIQASLRIYRKISASTGEEIKYISGLTISIVNTVNPDIIPNSDHIGDATSTTAQLSIAGAVEKPGYFTINGLKTWPGLTRRTRTYSSLNSAGTKASRTMTGIYLEDLLTNVLKLKSNAKSITVTASDGYYFEFNLDSNVSKMDAYTNYAGNFQAEVPGVYYTDKDGNKLMLAWEENGSALSSLRLVVGQINPDHINNPMWVNNINSITVNTQAVGKLDTPITTSSLETAASLILKATITTTNNVVTASNTAKEVSQALASINAVSASQETKSKTLIIDATTEEETTKTKYSLPSEALQALSANEQTELELLTDQGSLFFSAELLKYLNSDNKETLVIEIETIDPLENDYLAATAITINLGNKVIHSLNNMLLKANTPFIPEASLKKEGIVLYRLDNNEEKTLIKLSAYDQKSNSMRHGLWHLSTYVIGYSPVTFPDIHGHWGKSYIEFLAARHIVNGRTEDIFDPDGKITRAEFVKMLAETVDFLDMSSSVPAGFSDVPKSAWYAGYINWAAALGIVQGNTDGTFRPNNMINREQMAAMTERFIRSLKFNIKATEKAIDFTDQQQISSYAINAIRAMQQYAILAGNPDGSFKPQSPTSRSEAAKVITTLIEAILK
ncbi:MAG: S-layer homology domain-containing protein, partial [Firmicutes bacterium]|nr:S-layer homology domain-containing protein [Bacillota bacterium]